MNDLIKLVHELDDSSAAAAHELSGQNELDTLHVVRNKLLTSIEALQTELTTAQDELNCTEETLEAASCDLSGPEFENGFDCMGDFAMAVWQGFKKERDALLAEVERLQREVVNRNQRALDGDKAILVRDAEFARNEALQAEVEHAEIREAKLKKEFNRVAEELAALKGAEPVAYGDAARRRGKQVGSLWHFDDLGLSMFVGEVIGQFRAAHQAQTGEK